MRLSDQTVDEVKSRIDIVDVIGDFVNLKKAGQNYKGLSPFTNEKTPSFFVSPSKGIYKCFSSGHGGDAISFVMEYEGLSYLETIKFLAQKYGIEIQEEEQTDDQILAQNERESLYIAVQFANKFFQDILWNSEQGQSIGLSYFKERGFNQDTIKQFELGYSLDEWDHLADGAQKQGHNPELLEKVGLIIKRVAPSNGKSGIYDRFRGRVIFPIHNLTGKVIAFGARTLKPEKNPDGTPRKEPKYLNSPESEIYHKGRILYGIYQAKQAIRNKDNVFLVEGYTDVISLTLSGVNNVVASSGTSLTEDQILLIGRFTKNITVLFDGDQAGLKASLRGINMLLKGDMNVKAVLFPDGEDPDSYSRKVGYSDFGKFLHTRAKDFISFKTDLYLADALKDPIKKAETVRDLVESISLIPDPIKRTVYIKELSDQLDIDERTLVLEQNKFLIRKDRDARKDQYRPSAPPVAQPYQSKSKERIYDREVVKLQERESIRLLINYGMNKIENKYHLYDFLLKELEDIQFTTPVYGEIFELFKQELAGGKVIDADFLLNADSLEIRQEVINLITDRYEISNNWEELFHIHVPKETEILKDVVFTNILRLKFRVIRNLIGQNMKDLKIADTSEEQNKHQKIHDELKKSEMEIAKLLGNVAV